MITGMIFGALFMGLGVCIGSVISEIGHDKGKKDKE